MQKKKKNGFPMPTAKNGFHILNLHPKKYICISKNTLFKFRFTRKIPYFQSLFVTETVINADIKFVFAKC